MPGDEWRDATHPPVEPATDLGGGVWASWVKPWSDPQDIKPMIWHWCNRQMFIVARDRGDESEVGRLVWWYYPRWVAAGVSAHDFISKEPLHLEPSLLWPDCCGMHGFIRDGKWVGV